MLLKAIEIAFYISCVVNATMIVILLIWRFIKYDIPLILLSAFSSAVFSLLIIGLAAFAVWKMKAVLRFFVLIISLVISIFGIILTIVGNMTYSKKWGGMSPNSGGKNRKYYMEMALECCGNDGPNDYQNSNMTIPVSCYKSNNASDPSKIYKIGCSQRWNELRPGAIQTFATCLAQPIYVILLGVLTSTCTSKRAEVAQSAEVI